ncbi:DNA polymerase III subunit gamma/tau [Sporanaerobium hydrogeniformans]|uniref:DNA polymerase III subunit gamma/tau n=1 Tax=Sporanaerobium hydrogeniformans TaxID=3072179 RepID=A0AC61D9R8_9FIRM|nr:DNA polymerase III subunit gamma/tau [Sporanaerobium hydrogeniformans]PHV70024.1 DNA polymerase III subunit gamma/tau [Sporanaerobium hydrogeniformans]
MSYLALYRKYRPHTFDDVIGQEHIVRTLKNQIHSGRVAHAYLFCGSRGTGKTSIAKIFARAVNCETPINGSACGSCGACRKVQDGSGINIIEMDAASHNGVDNIREINDEVKYTPAVGKYKVYIIDEVHMLSTGAFNALLKTLEEPPAHVIFILATTDPQKIPVTILSRCQRFDFKRISAKEMEERLATYMQKEGVAVEENALAYIARLADGGMRDALSLLEQSISFYYEETITLDKVLYLVGAVDSSILFDMIYAIIAQDASKVLALCEAINSQGRSIKQFASDLLEHSRNLLVAKTTNGMQGVLDYSSEYIESLQEQAKTISTDELMRYIKNFGQLEYELRSTLSPRIVLEVTLLKLTEVQMDTSPESMLARMHFLEEKLQRLEQEGLKVAPIVQPQVVVSPQKESVPKRLPKAVSADIRELIKKWRAIKEKLPRAAWAIYESCEAGFIEDDIFYVVYKKGMEVGVNTHLDILKKTINEIAGKEVQIRTIAAEDYASKCFDVYGTSPQQSEAVSDIASILRNVESKVNFNIQIKN